MRRHCGFSAMKLLGFFIWICLAAGAPEEPIAANESVSYTTDDTPWSPMPALESTTFEEVQPEELDDLDEEDDEEEPTTHQPTTTSADVQGPAWLEPLRRSVYLAIVRERINRLIKLDLTGETPPADLWPSLEHAPLLGDEEVSSGIGHLIQGRLIRTAAKQYVFQVDSENNELSAENESSEYEETVARWSIKRVRRSMGGELSKEASRRELILQVALGDKGFDEPVDTFTIKDPTAEVQHTTMPSFFPNLPSVPPKLQSKNSRGNRKGKRPTRTGRPLQSAEPRGHRRPARTFWMHTNMFHSPPPPPPPRFIPMPPLPARIAMMLSSSRPQDQVTKHSQPRPSASAPPQVPATVQAPASPQAQRPVSAQQPRPHHYHQPIGPAPTPQYIPWRSPTATWYEIRPQHHRLPHPPPPYTFYRPHQQIHQQRPYTPHYPTSNHLPNHYPSKPHKEITSTAKPATVSTTIKPTPSTKKPRSKARSTTTTVAPASPLPSIPVPAPIHVPYVDIEHIKPQAQQQNGQFQPSRPNWYSEPDPLQPPTVVLTLGDSIKRNNTASYHLQLLVNNQTNSNRFLRTTARPPMVTSSKPTSFPTVLPTYEELFISKWNDQVFAKMPKTTTAEPTTVRTRSTTTTTTPPPTTTAEEVFDVITAADSSFEVEDTSPQTTTDAVTVESYRPIPKYEQTKHVTITTPKLDTTKNIQKIIKKEKFTLNDAVTKPYYKYPTKSYNKLTILGGYTSHNKPATKPPSKTVFTAATNGYPSSTPRPVYLSSTQKTTFISSTPKALHPKFSVKQGTESTRKRLFALTRRGQDWRIPESSLSSSTTSSSTSTTTQKNYESDFNDDDLSVTVSALTGDDDWRYSDQTEGSSNIIKGGQYELADEGSVEPLQQDNFEDGGYNVIDESKEYPKHLWEGEDHDLGQLEFEDEQDGNKTVPLHFDTEESSDDESYYDAQSEPNKPNLENETDEDEDIEIITGVPKHDVADDDNVEHAEITSPKPIEIPVTEDVNEDVFTSTTESPVEINTKKSLVTSISLKVGQKNKLYTTPRYGEVYLDEHFQWVENPTTAQPQQNQKLLRRSNNQRIILTRSK